MWNLRISNAPQLTTRPGRGGQKVLLPPINFIFKLLQQRATLSIWLYENLQIRIEGKLRVRTLTWPYRLNS